MTIFISPLIKAHAYFAIIEGHVFICFYMFFRVIFKTKREE